VHKKFKEIHLAIQNNESILKSKENRLDLLGRRIVRTKRGSLPIERFITKVLINPENGCWEWQGAKASNGYGQFKSKNNDNFKTSPHKFIYEYLNGPVPAGKELDHKKCNNRICCNPKHLKVVTHPENVKRNRKKKCKHGHPMTEQNIYVSKAGKRFCRKCISRNANESMKRRMERDPEFREKRLTYLKEKSREKRESKKSL
jgi:hypothetical protein